MNPLFSSTSIAALTVTAVLMLVPEAARSERPVCASIPPPGPAVCFIEEPFIGVFYESPAADPQQMVLLLFADRTDDFVTAFPDGKLFAHTLEREAQLTWCPFPFAEFDFANPQPECVFGSGTLAANGYIELSGDLACPFTAHVSGSGIRGTDAAAFDINADIVAVPTPMEPGGCRYVKETITAEPVD